MNNPNDTIRIRWTETSLKIGTESRIAGDEDRVSQEEYDEYCLRLGWAENAESGETGIRKPGSQRLQINSVKTVLK